MKKWLSRMTKLTVLLALLTLFTTMAFAAQEMTVNSTKLENGKGVEVEWDYLADYKGMDVWCAAYDGDSRIIAIEHANMKAEGKACRIKCDAEKVAYVKLFLLGEQIKPAEDVVIPGQDRDSDDPEKNHIHVWELEEVLGEDPNPFLKPGKGRYKCSICNESQDRDIPAQADPEERELVQRAEDAGLLDYIEITDLGEVTRLDAAKLVAAFVGLDVNDIAECNYADCGDLTSEEKCIINAAVQGDIMRVNGDGNFYPNATLTRSEFILILMNCVGNPECDWKEECTGVPEWNKYDANTLYNLGILGDDPDIRGNDRATKADVLEWMMRAMDWGDPAFEITNARFELSHGQPRIVFDIPAAATGEESYVFYVREGSGRWNNRQRTDSTKLFIGSFEPEVDYEMIVATEVDGRTVAWKKLDLGLNIVSGAPSNATAAFRETVDNGRAAYICSVTGGTPNANFMVYIWEEGRGSCSPGGALDANGEWTSIENGDHTVEHIANGEYFIREFENLTISTDGKSCSSTARDSAEGVCIPTYYGYALKVSGNTITFWDGDQMLTLTIDSDQIGKLNAGDFVSYSLNDAGEMTDIETDVGSSAAVIGLKGSFSDPTWLSLSLPDTTQLRADCAQDCVIIYVDTEAGTGVSDGKVGLTSTPNVRYILNDAGEIEVLFVAVNGNISSGDQDSAYAVSNIRFAYENDWYCLKWDVPETTEKLYYRLKAMNRESGQWEGICGSSRSQNPMDAELNGTYTGIKVITVLNGEEVAECVNEALMLDVQMVDGYGGAGVQVTYEEKYDIYHFTVTGVDVNATYFEIMLRQSLDEGGYQSLVLDSLGDGTAVSSISGSGDAEFAQIVESGYYRVVEFSDYSMSPDGNSVCYTVTYRGDWTAFNH